METEARVERYLATLPAARQREMRALHEAILGIAPGCRLWFLDGKDESGKVVSNPSIGYGTFTKRYADGRATEAFRVGISANTAGMSVYVMGLEDRTWLARTYAAALGRAKVTGYCIKFKSLGDVDREVLAAAIRDRLAMPPA